jgi:D-serine deaminase-like pyridoxal phosphate-dependent protein
MRQTPTGRRGPFPRLETGDPPRRLRDLETPAALVDLDRLAQNLDRMAAYTALHGLALRPHVKTHKSPRIAAEQLRLGARGLTCATPREAEVMSDVSDDILVAYPPVAAARALRIAALPGATKVTVALDSVTAVEEIARATRATEREVSVLVEVDVGMHRVGVADAASVIELVRLIRSRGLLRYAGIAFYPGQIREHVSEQNRSLERLTSELGRLISELDRAGCTPWVVSGGSTPAAWRMHEVARVNEVRPGTYVYNDRTTAQIGACAWSDCAFSVLATVVSTSVSGQAVIDAGTKALGREPMRGADGEGYGAVLDRSDVVVTRMSEEHGVLDLSRTDWRPEVGDQVRVVPNHVCVVVHLNDEVFGVRGEVVETRWEVAARGR